jgi:hypothetical protein
VPPRRVAGQFYFFLLFTYVASFVLHVIQINVKRWHYQAKYFIFSTLPGLISGTEEFVASFIQFL